MDPQTVPDARWTEAAARFGLAGRVVALVGERTRNAAVLGPTGDPVAVLKLHRLDERADVDLETAALQHLRAATRLTGRIPRVLVSAAGESLVETTDRDGAWLARALTWLSGRTWRAQDAAPQRLADLGALVAEVDAALASFEHPRASRSLRWNLLEAGRALEGSDLVDDARTREAARVVLEDFAADLAPRLAALPRQVLHNDANPANILIDDAGRLALIDFGDVCRAPRVCGLAVALAYAMAEVTSDLPVDEVTGRAPADGGRDPVVRVLPLVAGYHRVTPLTDEELALLLPLARTRLAVSAVMAAWQHAADPDNDYLLASQPAVRPALHRLRDLNDHLTLCRFREAVGLEPCPRSGAVRSFLVERASRDRLAPVLGRPLAELGFRVMDWSGPAPPRPEVSAERLLVGRYLEDRAVYTTDAFVTPSGERRTVHLGVDLFLPAGHPVHAPLDGVVELVGDNAAPLDYGPVVVLRHGLPDGEAFFTLYGHLSRAVLAGLRVGQRVAAGEVFAAIGSEAVNGGWAPHVHLQILTDLVGLGRNVPGVAARSQAGLWASLCPDPTLLLDLPEDVWAGGGRGGPR